MGLIHREGWENGWDPSADLVKGPKKSLLRFDNLVLDERGSLTLRPGAGTLNPVDNNGVPVPMNTNQSSVHSLYTVAIDNHRFRCAGVDEFAYKNFSAFATLGGTGDMAFGSFQGHILVARGETKWKNDGVTTRTWGIDRPTQAPGVSVLDPRIIIVSTFDDGETPVWTAKEGSVGAGEGQDGLSNGSRNVTSASSGKATIEKLYPNAQNFDSFDNGEATGALEDRIEFYAWVSNPDALQILTVAFDCNPNSKAPFQDDYFYQEFTIDEATEVKLDEKTLLEDRQDVEGIDRDDFLDRHERRAAHRTRVRRDTPSANVGWSKFVVFRGQMERVGSTPGCNWSTIKAVQLGFKFSTDSETNITVGRVRFDGLRILGGSDRTLTGKFRARAVWAREFDGYTALSGPSDDSDEIECMNNAIVVTIPSASVEAKDGQLMEVGGRAYAYIGGGSLRSYYRMGDVSSQVVSGSIGIPCTISEREALIQNLPLETNNQVPPDDIIGPHGIIGPHYNKIIVLTRKEVWVSRDGNPDSFWNSLEVADDSERIQWGIIIGGEILIGTTKDIYRLMGSLSELPDGSIDARLESTSSVPPISEFMAQDGDTFVYLASDGFRIGAGSGSHPINYNLDTLVGGGHLDRYGVNTLNLGLAPGKFRGGMSNGRLWILAFEGASELSSNIVYVLDMGQKRWRREQYPRSLQSLYREPTGAVLAGDSSGCLWLLNVDTSGNGDAFGNQSIAIPVVVHTVSDDNDQPLTFKEWQDWRVDINTAYVSAGIPQSPAVASVQILLDEVLATTLSVSAAGYQTVHKNLGDLLLPRAKRIQHKITGSFFAFKMGSFSVFYRETPVPMLFWDLFVDFSTLDQVWIREVEVKARCAQNIKVRALFDGEERTLPSSGVITVRPNVESTYPLEIGRSCHGRLPHLIFTQVGAESAANAVEIYWVKVKARVAGRLTEKTFKMAAPNG